MAVKTEDRGARLSVQSSLKTGRALHQNCIQSEPIHSFVHVRPLPAVKNTANARHTSIKQSMAALLLTTARLAHARLAHAARHRRGLAAVPQTVSDDEFQKIKDELTVFMHDRIYPNEQLFLKQSHESRGTNGKEWTHPQLIVDLMVEAKQRASGIYFCPPTVRNVSTKGASGPRPDESAVCGSVRIDGHVGPLRICRHSL